MYLSRYFHYVVAFMTFMALLYGVWKYTNKTNIVNVKGVTKQLAKATSPFGRKAAVTSSLPTTVSVVASTRNLQSTVSVSYKCGASNSAAEQKHRCTSSARGFTKLANELNRHAQNGCQLGKKRTHHLGVIQEVPQAKLISQRSI